MHRLTLDNLPEGEVATFAQASYTRSPAFEPECHDHTFMEFFWVEGGSGYEWIAGSRRRLEPGMLVLVRPEDRHGFSAAEEAQPLLFTNFAFPVRMWAQLVRRAPALRGRFFDLPAPAGRVFSLSLAEMDHLRLTTRDLRRGHLDWLTSEAFLSQVLALLSNREGRLLPEALPPWMAAACDRMRDYPTLCGGTPELVRLCGRSAEHVSREFRRHLGCSPTVFVNTLRLEWAAGQLVTTDRTILDIVADCGFENVGHFYSLFRRRFGLSPRRYRMRARPGRMAPGVHPRVGV